MKFVGIYTCEPGRKNDANARFLETGGQPPEGIRLVGRWHDIGGGRGFSVFETDDTIALSKWSSEWSDLLSIEIVPVNDDEEAAQILRT